MREFTALAGLLIFLSATGCGPDRVERAEELRALGMMDEAQALLAEEIRDNPGNSRAHFATGGVYMASGLQEKAVEAFGRAKSLDPALAGEAGALFLAVGEADLDSGSLKQALLALERAASFDSALAAEAAKLLRDAGMGAFSSENSRLAERHLSSALVFIEAGVTAGAEQPEGLRDQTILEIASVARG